MAIKAKIAIDDDRWAKQPYALEFDDEECSNQFGRNYLDGRHECYRLIEEAKAAGFDIDPDVEEYYY